MCSVFLLLVVQHGTLRRLTKCFRAYWSHAYSVDNVLGFYSPRVSRLFEKSKANNVGLKIGPKLKFYQTAQARMMTASVGKDAFASSCD